MLNSTDLPSQQSPLLQFLLRHPLLCLSGFWGTFLLAATLSFFSVFTPGPKAPEVIEIQQQSEPLVSTQIDEPVPEDSFTAAPPPLPEPPPEATPSSFPIPLWLVAAIAASCAGGSLIVTYALKQATSAYSAPAPPQKREKRKPKKRPAPVAKQQVKRKKRPPSQQPSTRPQSQVTILPPEVPKVSTLAEQMDLRKRHSLSSLMETPSRSRK